MKRKFRIGAVSVAAASTAVAALAFAGPGAASAAPRPAVVRTAQAAACGVVSRNHSFPRTATTYRAGAAGSVTVSPVNSGTIKVSGVHFAKGWRGFVDSSSGSSVDVYFRSGRHTMKFEAEINDLGGLTVIVTSC
jgi:hypothetical protein